MNLVICMAGKNTRFHDLGYELPKYLLPVGGKTLIYKILENLNYDKIIQNIYLIPHERDRHFYPELIQSVETLGFPNILIKYIGSTSGQAETAAKAIRDCDIDLRQPIVFHNADTILLDRNLKEVQSILLTGTPVVDVFTSANPEYSYTNISGSKILEIVEKKVISSHASSGFYGFPNSLLFLEHYSKNNRFETEKYISNVIESMIESGIEVAPIFQESDNPKNTIVLGTPKEYSEYVTYFSEIENK